MTKLLLSVFVKEDCSDPMFRQKCGMLGSVTGMALNIFLALIKLFAGVVSNSIAITADAVNNLSDAANCAVTMLGFKMSNRPADDKHPFGHGRYEYIAGMIVSLAVIVFGIELLKTSVVRIFHPEELTFNVLPLIILCVSIIVKVWLAFFYKTLAEKISSPALAASSTDSLTDCAATAVSAVSLVVMRFFAFNIDAYLGLPVALLIAYSGVKILIDTLDPLIGQPADRATAQKVRRHIMSCGSVLGLHDLILHSYGPDHVFGTVDVEMPSDLSLVEVHNIVDDLERQIAEKYSISLSIHVDPVENDSAYFERMRNMTQIILRSIDEDITFHDLRVIKSPLETNFVFDAVVTERSKLSPEETKRRIEEEFRKKDKTYCAVVTVERNYTK